MALAVAMSVVIPFLLRPALHVIVLVVLSQYRCPRLLWLRAANALGAVIPARVAAADLLLRIQPFEREIDARCQQRRGGAGGNAGMTRQIDESLYSRGFLQQRGGSGLVRQAERAAHVEPVGDRLEVGV